MPIDFAPLHQNQVNLYEFSQPFSLDDFREAINASIDTLVDMINQTTDEQIVHLPIDPDANDPHATADEQKIGWSLGHLVLHVTASSEEGASWSSILARGIAFGNRMRHEESWHTHCRTRAACLHRLEESRRMRLAYLDAWPDTPHLDVFWEADPTSFLYQLINAKSAIMLGLSHEMVHHNQFREALRQAQAAYPSGA